MTNWGFFKRFKAKAHWKKAAALSLFAFFPLSQGWAAVVTWDGGGSTNNWSEGANWSTNLQPLSTDIATFDGTSTKDATIDVGFPGSIQGIDINAGYTGTITQARTLTVGSSHYDQAAGTFTGDTNQIDINGNFTLSGGTFTSTSGSLKVKTNFTQSGGTFNHNSGTILFDDASTGIIDVNGSITFHHVELNSTATESKSVAALDTLIIAGNLSFRSGQLDMADSLNPPTVELRGNLWLAALADAGSDCPITFGGSANQGITIEIGATNAFDNPIVINKSSGTVTLNSDMTMNAANQTFTLTSGTFDLSPTANLTLTSNMNLNGGTFRATDSSVNIDGPFVLAGATFEAPDSGNASFGGDFTITSGTFNHNSGTILFDGNLNRTIDVPTSLTFHNLAIDKVNSGEIVTITSGDTLIINNDLDISGDGKFNTGTIEARGTITTGTAFDGGTSPIMIVGPATRSFTLAASSKMTDQVVFDASNATINGNSSGIFTFSTLEIVAGTFNGGSGQINFTGPFIQTGGAVNLGSGEMEFASSFSQEGGTFTGSSGTVDLNGAFSLSNSGTVFTAPSGLLTVGSSLSITDATFNHNSGTVVLDGVLGTKTVDVDTSLILYNLNVDRVNSGEINDIGLGDTLVVNNNLNISGDGKLNTGSIEVKGTITTGSAFDGGTSPITISGNTTRSFTLSSGKLTDNVTLNAPNVTMTGPTTGTVTFTNFILTTGTLSGNAGMMSFTGTFTQNGGTVNLGSGEMEVGGSFSQTGGTFNGSTGLLDLNGTFSLSNPGTIFNAPSNEMTLHGNWTHTDSSVFNHNNGLVTLDSTGVATIDVNGTETFYDFKINTNNTEAKSIAAGDTLIVTHDTSLINGTLNSVDTGNPGDIEALGHVTVNNGSASTWDGGTAPLIFSGSANQNFNLSPAAGAGAFNGPLTVNKSGGSVTLLSNFTADGTNQTFTLTAGTFDIGTYAFRTANAFTQDTGTFTGTNGSVDLDGTFLLNNGIFNAPTGSLTVANTFTIMGGTFNHNSGTTTFDGSGGKTVDVVSSLTLGSVVVNKTGNDTITIASGDTLIATGAVTITNGTFGTGVLEAQGNVTLGTSADSGTSPLRFTGSAIQSFNASSTTNLYDGDIFVNKSGGRVELVTNNLSMNTAGQDLTIEEGTFHLNGRNLTVNGTGAKIVVENGGVLQLNGSETITALASYPQLDTGSTVTYSGSGSVTIKDWTYHHLTLNGGGPFLMGTGEVLGGNLNILAGILDLNGQNLTVSGSFENLDTIRLRGNEATVNLPMDTNSGTAVYNGTATYTSLKLGNAYHHLVFNGAGGTWNHDATLDVNGNLNISLGTLDSNGQNITLAGNWTNNGTYTSGGNTVTLDGANQTLTGTTTFNDLIKSVSSAATITFASGTTFTTTGMLTLEGASGQPLSLRSSNDGVRYQLDPQGGRNIQYLDVKDSDNTNTAIANCWTGCTDSLNNVKWSFAQPSVTLSIAGTPLAENGGIATLTATLSAPSGANTTVNLAFSGTATNVTDYTRSAASIVILAGNTTGTATLTGVDDNSDEADESIIVDISSVVNASESGTQQVTANITDDDTPPSVTLGVSGSPLAEDGGVATFTATLSEASGQDVTVNLAFSGTATNVTDYTRSGASIVINSGSTTGTMTVTGVDDALDEAAETVIVDIASVTGGTESGTQQATATITDDDTTPSVTLGVSGSPAAEDGGTATFTATLSAASGQDVTVNLAYSGTATNVTDYTRSGTSIIINAGDTTGTATVTGVDDTLDEANETVIVDISGVTNATESGTQQETATFADDDNPPTVTLGVSGSPTAENGGTATFTATLSTASGRDVTVDLAYSGTATNVSDYTRSGTSIVINAGATTGTLTVTGVDDVLDEADETVIVDISSVTNGTESGTQQATAAFVDDDASPSVTLGLAGSPLDEEAGVATVTATLSAASGRDVTIDLAFSGTATNVTDYARSADSIIISAGSTTGTITLTGAGDALDETDETVIIDVNSITNGTESGTQQVTATITDDDATPTVTLGVSGTPFAENGGTATFTATLSAASGQDVTVDLSYSGTATLTTDYTRSGTSITISAGNTTGTATVTGVDDLLDEAGETVIVDISGVTNATESGTQQATATITDDDSAPSVTIAADVSPISENAEVSTVTATLSAVSGQNVTVNLAYSGTATNIIDYASSATFITIPAGSTTGTVTITGADDALNEAGETVIIDVDSVTNGTESGTQQVTVTITDDDTAPSVTLGVSGTPFAENGGTATFTATLSAASGQNVTVDLAYSGTATLTSDYTRSGTSITINAGSTTGTATVTGVDDLLDEAGETVIVDISGVTNGTESGTQQATATITDDDATPSVTLGVSGSPLAENGGVATFTATLSDVSGQDVTVNLAYSGTATNVTDYTRSGTSITINAGSTTGTATVTGASDSLDEADETVIVDISSVSNANEFGTQQATATITDDDTPPSVTLGLSGSPLAENGGISTLTATLSVVSGQDVTVNLAYSGTATDITDYAASGSSITILAGNTTGTATITGANDSLDESDETVIVDISSVTNGTESGTQQVTATITDDDAPPTVSLSVAGSPLAEDGGTATFTATLSGASGQNVIVNLAYSGTATLTTDYTRSATSITILAGNTTGTATVTGVDDVIDEAGETVIVDISSVTNGTESGTQQATAIITDDDASPTVTLGLSGSPLAEDGGIGTITATLSEASEQNVLVNLAYSGTATLTSDYTRSGTSISIIAGNTTGTATVTGVDDLTVEADETIIIDISSITNGTESGTQQVTATITDDDDAALIVNEPSGATEVAEGGATDTFTVVLATPPTHEVLVNLDAGDQVELDRSTLTFTTGNWNVVQTVTVTADDDQVAEGNHNETITMAATSNDPAYAGLTDSVEVAIVDNDAAGISVVESGGTSLTVEGGATDEYSIVLTSEPQNNVTVSLTVPTDLSTSTTTLVFTSLNWQTPQTVTVTANDDNSIEGNEAVTITQAATSSDTDYNGISVASVVVQITDNDSAGVTRLESGGATVVTASGTEDSFTLALTSEPTADVTVTVAGDSQLDVSPTALTFTSGNWNTAQAVTVALSENADLSVLSGTISFSATSGDGNYASLPISSLTVSIQDDTDDPDETDDGDDDDPEEPEEEELSAQAGPDKTVIAGRTVMLDASQSTGEGLSYSWTVSPEIGSLSGADSALLSFTAPTDTEAAAVTATLTITDGHDVTDTDTVTINVIGNVNPQAEIIDTDIIGVANGTFVSQEILSTGETTLVTDTATIILPQADEGDSTQYAFTVSGSGYLIIGVPGLHGGRGSVYVSRQTVDLLTGEIDLGALSDAQVSNLKTVTVGDLPVLTASTDTNDFASIAGAIEGDELGEFLTTGDSDGDGVDEIYIAAPGAGTAGFIYIYDETPMLVGVIRGSENYPVKSILTGNYLFSESDDLMIGPKNKAMNSELRYQETLSNDDMSSVGYLLSGENTLANSTHEIDLSSDIDLFVGRDQVVYQSAVMGDLNGDGLDDIILATDLGIVLIYFGPTEASELSYDQADVVITDEAADPSFGRMMAITNLGGSAVNDLIIGAPNYGPEGEGAVYVVYGDENWEADISTSAGNVLLIPGTDPEGHIGSDLLLSGDEIYTVTPDGGIYRISMGVTGGEEGGVAGNSLGAAGGCHLSAEGGQPGRMILLFMALAILLSVRSCKKRRS